MATNPAWIFATGGAVALAGGYAHDGKFPKNGVSAVMATGALMVVGSALQDSKIAPIVRSIAWLFLLGAAWRAIPGLQAQRVSSKKRGKTRG